MPAAIVQAPQGHAPEQSADACMQSVTQEMAPPQESEVPFNEQTMYTTRGRIISIFLACSSVDALSLIDQTSLTVALPIIGEQLGAGNKATWFANGYFVTSTAFQLLYGRFSDIWSRKIVILMGLPIYFFASLAASLAQTPVQLIIFRAFAGIGGGGLLTLAQIIVSDVVTLRERGKYQGILGAVAGLANGIGPVIGGAIAEVSFGSWRWIFRLNLFLSIFATLAVVFYMPLRNVEGSKIEKMKSVDLTGAGLVLVGTTLVVISLTWAGGEYQWLTAHVLAPLYVGAAIWIGFVLWELRAARYPVMPLHIFSSRMVNGAILSTFVNGWLFFTQVFFIPQFYQILSGLKPVVAGALIIPLTITHTLSSTIGGLLVSWTGRYRELILIGWALWAIASGLWSTCNESSGLGKYVGFSIMMGFGVGQTLQPTLVGIQAGVARRDMAVVTSARNFARSLGGSFGLAVGTTIINNSLRSALSAVTSSTQLQDILGNPIASLRAGSSNSVTREALMRGYESGFRILFQLNAALASAAFVVAWFLIPHLSLDRKDDKDLKREEAERVKAKRDSG